MYRLTDEEIIKNACSSYDAMPSETLPGFFFIKIVMGIREAQIKKYQEFIKGKREEVSQLFAAQDFLCPVEEIIKNWDDASKVERSIYLAWADEIISLLTKEKE